MDKRQKYDYAFKLQCVEAILEGKVSVKGLAKERGMDHSNLRLWLKFYESYGEPGLKPRSKRHYDISFKLSVLKAIDTEHLSLRDACVRFNIPSESVIINWQRAYEDKGRAAPLAHEG